MFICSALWVRWDSCRSLSPNQQIIKFMSAIKLTSTLSMVWYKCKPIENSKVYACKGHDDWQKCKCLTSYGLNHGKGETIHFLVISEESHNWYANNLTQFVHKFYGLSTSLQCFYANFHASMKLSLESRYAKIISLLLSRLKFCFKTVWSISSNFESVYYIVIEWSHFLLYDINWTNP